MPNIEQICTRRSSLWTIATARHTLSSMPTDRVRNALTDVERINTTAICAHAARLLENALACKGNQMATNRSTQIRTITSDDIGLAQRRKK